MGFGVFDFDDTKGVQKEVVEEPKTETKHYDDYTEKGKIQLFKQWTDIQCDKEFTADKFKFSLNFYDFEVFEHDWLVVIVNPITRIKTWIVNDVQKLREYYSEHKNELWVGYNSRNYDVYIMKGLLLRINPKFVSDCLIERGMKGFQIDDRFKDIQFYNFDCMVKDKALKHLEAFMGHDIRETEVPFDLPRPLIQSEIRQTLRYCDHDVKETMEVFLRSINEYTSQEGLLDMFGFKISHFGYTKAQLTAQVIGCEKTERFDKYGVSCFSPKYSGIAEDEFNLWLPQELRLEKYQYIADWFMNPKNHRYYLDNGEKNQFETNVCGIPHTYGWGGLHGCIDHPIDMEGRILHWDIQSMYPSIMIEYNLLTRNCKTPQKFKEVYDLRLRLKAEGKKKEQAPLKIVLNSTYGILKDRFSLAYDPLHSNMVCLVGQLLITDLLEKLEPYIELIQTNTDGIIFRIPDDDEYEKKINAICDEWSNRTRLLFSVDRLNHISQSTVNNYVFRFENGKLERKGAYTKESSPLDNDTPIIQEAIVQKLMNDISVEDTINNCDDLILFQKVYRVKGRFKYAWHNGEYLNNKTYRVFASTDMADTYIGKCENKLGKIGKFQDTPEHCFIVNENIEGWKVPSNLNRHWYISQAEKALREQFDVVVASGGLF